MTTPAQPAETWYNWGQRVYDTWLVPAWAVTEDVYHTFKSLAFALWLDVDPSHSF